TRISHKIDRLLYVLVEVVTLHKGIFIPHLNQCVSSRIILGGRLGCNHDFIDCPVVGVECGPGPELKLTISRNFNKRSCEEILGSVPCANVFAIHICGPRTLINKWRSWWSGDAVVKGPALAGTHAIVENSPYARGQFPCVGIQIRRSRSFKIFGQLSKSRKAKKDQKKK